ncbi:hypothetical protein O0L34_g15269 [Tuta absoluta]|nr:hypothetical protein O0L34_g15269 [Tuta absoluta]
MYFSLIILGVVAVAYAWPESYVTIRQEGLRKKLDMHKSFVIPSGHCSGYISKPDDYQCRWLQHVNVLRVSADDQDASPEIEFKDHLNKVFIYRKGFCNGESHVKLDYSCGFLLGEAKESAEVKDNVQTKARNGDTSVKSNLRILNPVPNQ